MKLCGEIYRVFFVLDFALAKKCFECVICGQREDGRYTARFVNKRGKRKQKYFHKLQECRQWIAEAEYLDKNSDLSAGECMTVDAWFEYFLNDVKT